MSKTPPGVQRVVAVLNFFAEHPGQSFSFTDIVKALDMGRATCHSLLAGLVEAQYLYRNIDKSYVIGPALAAIGRIANDQFSPMLATGPELRALSDRFRAVCSAVYNEDDYAVIHSRAGSGRQAAWSVPQGLRLPLRAPFAGAFFATASADAIDQWLQQLSPSVPDSEKRDLLAGVEFTRQHGFSFGELNREVELDFEAPELAFTGRKSEYPVLICSQLDPDAHYLLAFITSPVFNARGQVEFVLTLSAFRRSVAGAEIAQMGAQLRAAAERITYYLNGRSQPYPLPY